MKKFLIVTFSILFSVSCVLAGSDCYVVTEDALAADSEVTWEVANEMLKKQEMEKLTRLMLDGRIIVIKQGEKLRIMTLGKALNEVTKENDDKKWFISIEVARPCSK